jgi:hypothetical protein
MEIAASNNTVTIGEPIEVTVSASATNGCQWAETPTPPLDQTNSNHNQRISTTSDYGPGTYTVVATVLTVSPMNCTATTTVTIGANRSNCISKCNVNGV